MASRGLPWPPLASGGLLWPPMASRGLPWPPVTCPGLLLPPVASRGLSWSLVVPRGISWSPVVFCIRHAWSFGEASVGGVREYLEKKDTEIKRYYHVQLRFEKYFEKCKNDFKMILT